MENTNERQTAATVKKCDLVSRAYHCAAAGLLSDLFICRREIFIFLEGSLRWVVPLPGLSRGVNHLHAMIESCTARCT